MVAEVGDWLLSDKKLVCPIVMENPDWKNNQLPVTLNQKQLHDCPPIKADPPACEKNKFDFSLMLRPHQWGFQLDGTISNQEFSHNEQLPALADGYLRSMKEVVGYKVCLEDKEHGHIEDFIVDVKTWNVKYAVIDSRNWFPGGRKYLIDTDLMESVSWSDKEVTLDLKMKELKQQSEVELLATGNWKLNERTQNES